MGKERNGFGMEGNKINGAGEETKMTLLSSCYIVWFGLTGLAACVLRTFPCYHACLICDMNNK